MSDEFSPIRPRQVPLSHDTPNDRPSVSGRGASLLTWGMGLVLILALLGVVFFLVPVWLDGNAASSGTTVSRAAPPADTGGGDPTQPAAAAPAEAADDDEALPPYQQLKRRQAREQAQEELAGFVERQIELEENMQVGAWGSEAYDQAKSLAARGDEQFVRERYEEAVASYRQARESLGELIDRGEALLEKSLADGAAAIDARDAERAREAFELAATIAPNDPRVATGQARTALLPEITTLMRQGRNQELAEEWTAAAQTYARVAELDSATRGLEEAQDRVAEGRQRARVQALLSQGFSRLDEQRFQAARQAFREALDLAPGNAVAEGGLEQVDKRAEVAGIADMRRRAERAEAEERWDDAAERYAEVLNIDPTIRFAQAGRAAARAQQRARTALGRIQRNPERLSSEERYREAQDILARARDLTPRGEGLAGQIEDVQSILETYAEPVPVVLRSDNRTEVTLSTLGSLGSFTEKRLELRPGAYVVKGTSDGCRDVREQIMVRPNMNPVDVRCTDAL